MACWNQTKGEKKVYKKLTKVNQKIDQLNKS